jgi:predicted nucleic-acid-binding Zn-ribbon protein
MRKTMQNGICLKCQSEEVYEVEPRGEDGAIRLGLLARLPVRYLLCAVCGYMETYALDPSWAQEVVKKGRRIAARRAGS